MKQTTIDLDPLLLSSGEAATLTPSITIEPPVLAGEVLALEPQILETRVDVSRTTSGYALRLRFGAVARGTCSRCLEPAEVALAIDVREIDQPVAGDEELRSPYVAEGLLDVASWAHDAIMLALPEKLLCRADCAGLCEECGVPLNGIDPGAHTHERAPDPRFAKLRDLEI